MSDKVTLNDLRVNVYNESGWREPFTRDATVDDLIQALEGMGADLVDEPGVIHLVLPLKGEQ